MVAIKVVVMMRKEGGRGGRQDLNREGHTRSGGHFWEGGFEGGGAEG